MRKSLSGRRIPRKIGLDNEDEEPAITTAGSPSLGSAVKRPFSKPRKSSTLRSSLGPSVVEDDDSEPSAVVTPKRSQPSKVAAQINAAKRSSNLASQLPLRNLEDDDERPNYSASSLRQLKDSTPSRPRDLPESVGGTEIVQSSAGIQQLNLSSKFGSSLALYQHSAIPSEAEIAEKKARRARLALEAKADEYISLNPSDPELDDDDDDDNTTRDERGRLILKPKDRYGETESRLVREDEDMMENFDEFTEDGGISLGRKAELEAARRRKEEMAAQIAAAEGVSDSDADASERERNAAFEAAQTKHGTYARSIARSDLDAQRRPRTPPIITPLPTVEGVVERLRAQLSNLQTSRLQKLQEMEALQREKIRLAEEEVRVQNALRETAEKFEALRKEKGIIVERKDGETALATIPGHSLDGVGFGDELEPAKLADHNSSDDTDNEGVPGLGFNRSRHAGGGGAGLGMAVKYASDSDDY